MANQMLSQDEHSVILELANLTSGAATTTLGMLVDEGIEMGQPQVTEFTAIEEFVGQIGTTPYVMSIFHYLNGFKTPVCYLLDMKSAITLADIMMGGSAGGESSDISDIQISAVGEALSQMMGAAANSFSHFLSRQVDTSAPDVAVFQIEHLLDKVPHFSADGIILVKYSISGSNLLPPCELLQIAPAQMLKQQVQIVRTTVPSDIPEFMNAELKDAPMEDTAQFPQAQSPQMAGVAAGGGMAHATAEDADAFGYAASGAQSGGYRQTVANPVTVRPVEFPSFDDHMSPNGGINKNLELVMDVCLNLTVELGRSELPIKEVLELTRGSVIELNRVAGEAVDLYVNGKMIAKGEVVVIEDNFGLRITSIISPADRLRGL